MIWRLQNFIQLVAAAIILATGGIVFSQSQNRQAAALAPTQNQLSEAVKLLENKQFAEAEAGLKQILKKSPRDAGALTLLGIVYGETNRMPAAEAEYRAALLVNPQLEAAALNLATIYLARGESKKALPLLEKSGGVTAANKTTKSKNFALLFALTRAYAAEKRLFELSKTIDYIETLGGGDARVSFTLGLTLAQAGEYEQAAGQFEKVNAARPDTVEVLYNLGVAYYNTDKLDAAAAALERVVTINPNSAEAFYRLGLIASAKTDAESAFGFWQKALELKPDYAEANFLIGEELRKQKKYTAALPFYDKAAAQNQENPLYQLRLGVAYFRVKRYSQAGAIFEQMLEKYPNDFNFNYLSGFVARNQGLYDKAAAAFEKADKISPNNADVLESLGFIALQKSETEKAERLLRLTLRIDPKNFSAHYNLGRILVSRRNYAEALTVLEKGVPLNDKDPSIRYQLFLAYSRLRQKEKAAQSLAEFKRLEKEFSGGTNAATSAEQNQNLPDKIENAKP